MIKKILVISVALLILTCHSSFSQQQWRFPIVFEDGSGQRDSLWMVFDTTATIDGVDYHLGEGQVTYDPTEFNVFVINWDFKRTKTKSYPYYIFPFIDLHNVTTINCTYPVIIRWDTAMFHASGLPTTPKLNAAFISGSYFSNYPDDPTAPYNNTINMLNKDSLLCHYISPSLFPLNFILQHVDIQSIRNYNKMGLHLFPNPAREFIKIEDKITIKAWTLYNETGIIVLAKQFDRAVPSTEFSIMLNNLKSGIYFLKLIDDQNCEYYEKFIIFK